MKLIKCIVAEDKLESLQHALLQQGVQGMTVFPVRGYGIHRAQLEQKISRNYLVEFSPRVMIEIILSDPQVENTLKTITAIARTGRLGDGKVFVLPVEDALRLRTGERGESAL